MTIFRRPRRPRPVRHPHDFRNDCMEAVKKALMAEADKRKGRDPDVWVAAERQAIVDAANRWATRNGYQPVVTVEWIEDIEHFATGYIDYMRKISLYTADLVVYGIERPRI